MCYCRVRKTAEWWRLQQTGQCTPVWWGGFHTAQATFTRRDRAPASPDLLILQEKVEIWIFIFSLSVQVLTTDLSFKHSVVHPEWPVPHIFGLRQTHRALPGKYPTFRNRNESAPEEGWVCLCHSPVLPPSASVSVYLEYRDQRTFLSG